MFQGFHRLLSVHEDIKHLMNLNNLAVKTPTAPKITP